MAKQFIYSRWWEQQTERTLYASSEDVAQTDLDFLIHHVETVVDFEFLGSNEDNPELASTMYLQLPSGFSAILRTGKYRSNSPVQYDNYILHAIITQDGELSAPLLYAVNNCFRESLTCEEQRDIENDAILPDIAIPRPQYKLSQAEIEKYFSQGRLKTLACLIQATIDSYENQKMIILNDRLPNIKYWFYGLHCCLPYSIRKKLTYSTYSYTESERIKLICGAPNNAIDNDLAIRTGQFLIDNTGGKACEDIEPSKYAKFIVEEFSVDSVGMQYIPKNIDNFMTAYNLNLPTAAGIWKLMEGDFNWFESPYEIQVFFGKVNHCIPSEMEGLSESLWTFLENGQYKLPLDSGLLPLVSLVFRNGSTDLKERIILFVNHNRGIFDVTYTQSFKAYYNNLSDKFLFLYEYILDTVILEHKLDEYCIKYEYDMREITTLLCIIADRFKELCSRIDRRAIEEATVELFKKLLSDLPSSQTEEMIVEFCHKATCLDAAFIQSVIITPMWNHVQTETTDECLLEEKLIFSLIEVFIDRPLLSANLLRIYARKGKYAESTLKRYLNLSRDYPDATMIIDRNLEENETFSSFLRDTAAYRFASLEVKKEEELFDYFYSYYIPERDRNHVFMGKLDEFVITMNPVNQIDFSHEFLLRAIDVCNGTQLKELSTYLIPYINNQSVFDIFDYYANHDVAFLQVADIFNSCLTQMSNDLKTVLLIVALKSAEKKLDHTVSRETLSRFVALFPSIDPTDGGENRAFLSKLYETVFANQQIVALENRPCEELFFEIYSLLMSREDFSENYLSYLHSQRQSESMVTENVEDCDLIAHTVAFLSVTLPVLLRYTFTEEETAIENTTLQVVASVPYSIKREVYRQLLAKCERDESKISIRELLTELYYRDLTIIQKLSAPSPKKLFED